MSGSCLRFRFLVFAERIVHQRMRPVVAEFLKRGLVPHCVSCRPLCPAPCPRRPPGCRGRDKTISIDRATVEALRQWREVQDAEREFFGADYPPGDYVFTYPDGRPVHPDSIRQRFNRLAAAAGLPRITFHDLRHSYATGALRAGISPKIVSERIGHANIGFFLETYAHVLENDDREAAEQAASFLLGDAWELDN